MILTRDGKEITAIYRQDGSEVDEVKDAAGRLIYSASREITGTLPLSFTSRGNPLTDYMISGNTVQNGTPTPEAPVDVQGAGVRTWNLFNGIIGVDNVIISQYGNPTSNNTYALSEYIPVEPNTSYIYYFYHNIAENRSTYSICEYDSNKNVILPLTLQRITEKRDYNIRFTTQANTAYIRINWKKAFDDDLMLSLGSTALPYEPYGYKLPVSVNGTEYPIYLGEVPTTRKIKKLVLNGEEPWQLLNGNYYSSVIDRKGAIDTIVCSHFINSSPNGISYQHLSTSGLKIAAAGIPFVTSVNDLKAWLAAQYDAGTPVTVWYVLADQETAVVNEPLMKIGDYADTITMEQAGVTIPTVSGANVLDMTSTVKPSEVYIKGKGIKPMTNT